MTLINHDRRHYEGAPLKSYAGHLLPASDSTSPEVGYKMVSLADRGEVSMEEDAQQIVQAAIVATNMDKKIKERLKVCNRVDDPN